VFGQEDTLNIAGLGISIDPTKVSEMVYFGSFWQNYPTPITSTSAIEFYVPIKVTNKFRLEPSMVYSLRAAAQRQLP